MADILSKPNISELKKAAALAADAWAKCQKGIDAGVDLGAEAERCGHLQRSIQQLLDVYDSGKNWKTTQGNNGDQPTA